jgi:hypothetical protein
MIRSGIFAAIAVAAFGIQTSRAQAQPAGSMSADLAAVPADAIMLLHVRAAELWRSEPFKELRGLVERAGPKALQTYTKRFPISPALIDSVTLFGIPGPAERPQAIPPPLVAVSLNKAVNEAQVVDFFLSEAQTETVNGKNIFVAHDMCIYAINEKTFLVSAPPSVKAYLNRPKVAEGPMAMAKDHAAKHHVALAVNVGALPPEAKQQIPPPFQPLAEAKIAGVAIDVGTEVSINAGLQFADADAATAGEKAARDALAMARQHLSEFRHEAGKPLLEPQNPSPAPLKELPEALASFGALAAFGMYDEYLDKLPLAREGSNLVVRVKLPAHAAPALPLAAVAGGMMFAWVSERQAAPAERAVPAIRIQPAAPAKAAPPGAIQKAAPPKSVPPKSDRP